MATFPSPLFEQMYDQGQHPADSTEKAGVSGDAVHEPTVFIVYFTLYHSPPPEALFGGGDVFYPLAGRGTDRAKKNLFFQTQRTDYPALKKDIKRLAGRSFNNISQQNKTKIAVYTF